MSEHFDVVLSRLGNMLKRITAKDPDFDDICSQHAELTSEIRGLNPDADPAEAQRDEQLRHRRADLEDVMLAIMQANTRI
jgi:uncharacterized protein YdcH (DUF465 family)